MNKIEIPLSKKKIILTTLGAFFTVFLSILFILNPEKFVGRFLRTPEMVLIVGVIGALLFGILGSYGIKKSLDKKPGLTIDEIGINDNTNASSVGLIKWDEITEIKIGQTMSTKFLLIFTNNPAELLAAKTGIRRKILQGNMKMYGTPITITSTTLAFKFDDLYPLAIERLSAHREKMQQ